MDGDQTSNGLNFSCQRSMKSIGDLNNSFLLYFSEFLERIYKRGLVGELQGETIECNGKNTCPI